MSVPVVLRLIALVLGLGVGAVLIGSGTRGLRGTLRRFGVRTPAALRTAETARLANRVAGLPWVVGGSVAAVGGLLCLVLPGTASVITVLVVGLVGGLAIALAGGLLGNRAAAALPEPAPASAPAEGGCAGCACGGCG